MAKFRPTTQMLRAIDKITVQQPGVSRPSSILEGHRLCLPTHSASTVLADTYFETTVLRPRRGFVVGLEAQAMKIITSVKAEQLLAKHEVLPLSRAQERELDDIMQEAETVLLPSQARQTMSDRVKYDSFAAQCAVG